MRKAGGSITVFLALILTSVFAAVFAFLEAARVSGLSANAKVSVMQARDAVLASYDREIYKKYDLLFWQSPQGELPGVCSLESLQQDAVEGNHKESLLPRGNYYVLGVHLAEVRIPRYELASDDEGTPFRRQACQIMKESLAADALDTVLDWVRNAQSDRNSTPDLEEQALGALDNLEQAEQSFREGQSSSTDDHSGIAEESQSLQPVSQAEISENPLEWVKKVRQNGIFSIILPEEEMSEKQIEDLSSCVERRRLCAGNYARGAGSTETGKLLFHLYLDKYFYDYCEKSTDQALDYELEYMITGKGSDRENLKGVIRRLLALREASNLVYLEKSSEKQEEAHLIASALTSAVLSPELEPVVQQGILAAWAYAESVSDVRILLEGGKVSLLKTDEQWNTQITNLSGTVYTNDAASRKKGLSYANYLQLLLWAVPEKKLSCRAMDLIEKNTGVQMDRMVSAAECAYTFEAAPLFWNMVTLGNHVIGSYHFEEDAEFSFCGE